MRKKEIVVDEYRSAKEYRKGIRKMMKKGYVIVLQENVSERVGCAQILLFPPLIFRRNRVVKVVTFQLRASR